MRAVIGLLVLLSGLTASLLPGAEEKSFPPTPFKVGERLEFSVNWTVGNIGTAYLEVTGIDSFRADPCYRVVAEAQSNKTIDLLYPVRDYFLTLIDMSCLCSRKYTKIQREGGHQRNRELIYDQDHGLRYDLARGDTTDIPPEAQDELSIFYYFRTLDLKVGQGLLLEGFTDKQGNPLKVSVLRKEWVDVPVGRFNCWVVEPQIRSGGLFEHKGDLLIWITDDEHRIPVKMTSDLDFGSVVVLLESYRLGTGQPVTGKAQVMPGR